MSEYYNHKKDPSLRGADSRKRNWKPSHVKSDSEYQPPEHHTADPRLILKSHPRKHGPQDVGRIKVWTPAKFEPGEVSKANPASIIKQDIVYEYRQKDIMFGSVENEKLLEKSCLEESYQDIDRTRDKENDSSKILVQDSSKEEEKFLTVIQVWAMLSNQFVVKFIYCSFVGHLEPSLENLKVALWVYPSSWIFFQIGRLLGSAIAGRLSDLPINLVLTCTFIVMLFGGCLSFVFFQWFSFIHLLGNWMEYSIFFLSRLLQGITCGLVLTLEHIIFTDCVKKDRKRVFLMSQAASYCGWSISAIVGTFISDITYICILNMVTPFASIFTCYFVLPTYSPASTSSCIVPEPSEEESHGTQAALSHYSFVALLLASIINMINIFAQDSLYISLIQIYRLFGWQLMQANIIIGISLGVTVLANIAWLQFRQLGEYIFSMRLALLGTFFMTALFFSMAFVKDPFIFTGAFLFTDIFYFVVKTNVMDFISAISQGAPNNISFFWVMTNSGYFLSPLQNIVLETFGFRTMFMSYAAFFLVALICATCIFCILDVNMFPGSKIGLRGSNMFEKCCSPPLQTVCGLVTHTHTIDYESTANRQLSTPSKSAYKFERSAIRA